MESYAELIMQNLKGGTPREKYDFLCRMKELLSGVAFPMRGTEQEEMDIDDAAKWIQSNLSMEDLEIK